MATASDVSGLARNSLGTVEVTGMSVAGVGPTVGAALSTSLVASAAGAASPLAFLLAMLGCLALGFVFVLFCRRMAASGVAYTYIRKVFGKNAGFLGGWAYAGTYITSVVVILATGSNSMSALLADWGVHVSWFICFCVLLLLVFTLCYRGIRPSIRAQLTVEIVSMSLLSIAMIVVLAKDGASGLSWQPFNLHRSPTGLSGIGYGLVYAFSAFFGFEAGCSLGLEAKNPKRSIPRGVVSALIISAVFYVLIAYGLAVGFGVLHAGAWAADSTPLNTITSRFVGSWAAEVVDVMVVASAFAASVAALAISSRVLYSMGTSGLLPKPIARAHPRFRSPYVADIVGSVIALAFAAGIGLALGSEALIGLVAGSNTLAGILVYIVIAIAAIWAYAWFGSVGRRFVMIVVPLVAIVILGFAFKGSILPEPPFPYDLAPLWVAVWLAIGGVVLARTSRSGKAAEFSFEEEDIELTSSEPKKQGEPLKGSDV